MSGLPASLDDFGLGDGDLAFSAGLDDMLAGLGGLPLPLPPDDLNISFGLDASLSPASGAHGPGTSSSLLQPAGASAGLGGLPGPDIFGHSSTPDDALGPYGGPSGMSLSSASAPGQHMPPMDPLRTMGAGSDAAAKYRSTITTSAAVATVSLSTLDGRQARARSVSDGALGGGLGNPNNPFGGFGVAGAGASAAAPKASGGAAAWGETSASASRAAASASRGSRGTAATAGPAPAPSAGVNNSSNSVRGKGRASSGAGSSLSAAAAAAAAAGAAAGDGDDRDRDGGVGGADSNDEDDGDEDMQGDDAGTGMQRNKSSGSLRGMNADDKRQKRLERNRESARQSRRRKKQYLELLEGRVHDLHRNIAELRSAHCAAADKTLNEQRAQLLIMLEPLANKETRSPDEEAALQDGAAQLVDRYGPNCAERRAVRDFHFDQLQRLIMPPHTKFLLWLVHQPPEFFQIASPAPAEAEGSASAAASSASAAAPQHTLWTLLCGEIGLSTEQAEKLRVTLRRVVGSAEVPRETWRLGVANAYLTRLRAALVARAAAAQAQFEALAGILTAAQFVRYAAWLDRNRERLAAVVRATPLPGPASTSTAPTGAAGAAAAASPAHGAQQHLGTPQSGADMS